MVAENGQNSRIPKGKTQQFERKIVSVIVGDKAFGENFCFRKDIVIKSLTSLDSKHKELSNDLFPLLPAPLNCKDVFSGDLIT